MINTKICKTCGATIATNAKACPQCGAKNKRPIKKIIIGCLIFFFLIGIISAATSGNDAEKYDFDNPIVISAEELIDTYVDNQALAEETYEDQVVKVTGYVCNIQSTYCQIVGTKDYSYLTPRLQVSLPKERLATLKKGQKITVIGICVTSTSLVDIGDGTQAHIDNAQLQKDKNNK